MKKIFTVLFCIVIMKQSPAQINYLNYPVYDGTDLGLTYTATHSVFKIWSPVADAVELLLYLDPVGGEAFKTINLTKSVKGTWVTNLPGDWEGSFYVFRVSTNNSWSNEVPDPYAKAVGVNGKRAMILDLNQTNPAGWNTDKSPSFSKNNLSTDAVIYELHIRDASISENSGIKNKGKYLGLTEENTKSPEGEFTGLAHFKELGVTHIHLLPFFDFNSVDESMPEKPQYNWGYDPLNYNAPEGSYSTDAYEPAVRINELKKMILAFHENGLRVVMDVVFNHTALTKESNFNQLVPGYYYRHKSDGSFSNASACGNETASDLPMMQKFIIESVSYWAKEYHVDGFRFDLMGIHDIATMNLISDTLHKINPTILLYGEGWTAGDSPLPDSLRAIKKNVSKLKKIAVFGDELRDGIKGSVFDINDKGFASGKKEMEASVKFGIVAASNHPQVNFSKVNYAKKAYSNSPGSIISYCECHDNNTLWDKLSLSCKTAAKEELIRMHQLSLTIVLTSQGIPFLHAGTEFLRNKKGVENSFDLPDSINAINWSLKKENKEIFNYVQQLIKMRKAHPGFRMTTNKQIKNNILFDEKNPEGTIAYSINGKAMQDSWTKIFVSFNGTAKPQKINLPSGKWQVGLQFANKDIAVSGEIILSPFSAVIFYK